MPPRSSIRSIRPRRAVTSPNTSPGKAPGREVPARERAAGDLVHELVATALARGLEVDVHVPELASAPGLANEAAFDLVHVLADRFAVRDPIGRASWRGR